MVVSHSGSTVSIGLGTTSSDTERADHGRQVGQEPGCSYRLAIEYRSSWMEGDRIVEADPYFDIQPVLPAAILPEGLAAISHNAVNEQIVKANKRIAT